MDKPVRKAVRTFVIQDNKVLVIKYLTEKNNGFYDIPGGKIENGETNFDASIRECLEETGIQIINQKYIGNLVIEYPEMIFDLENELGINHKRNKYESFSLRFLPYYFGKSVSAIHVALHRMKKVFPYPITFEDEGIICVKAERIRWLYENYFKRDYLKELEEYKWELEKIM